MGTTTSYQPGQTTDDVNAIIAGMGRAPDALQPGYQPPMPVALQPSPQGGSGTVTPTVQLAGPPVPNQPSPNQPPPDQPNYTVSPVRPGDPGYQSPQQPPPQPPVALNRPPAFQLGHQPGPWPAAYPDSPRYEPSQAPPLPGETPQETADLNRHLGHETGNRGNIINDWAARDPSRYYNNGQTCSGYWQITNSTWADGAKRAGVDTRQYPTAMSAPYQVQRQVALALYRAYGNQPWTPQPGAGEHGDRAALRPQLPVPPDARDSQDWGHPPPRDFGPGPSGQQQGPFGQASFMQPGQSGFSRVFNAIAPLLVGIGSLALHLPLSTAITAYGAMARAQDNGQREAYNRARTQFQDQLKEANAQQTLESQAASDAFSEYQNNPQGLQQRLAQIALQYNDPTMYRMAERGDLNGIHQLQTKRDQYNQDLTKLNKANQDEQDRQAQNADVAARDRQYQQEHPDATPDELAIEHNKNIGLAQQDFDPSKTKTPTGDQMEAPIYNVLDKDGKPTGQQVRVGKNGGYFDPNTKQPVQLKPGETVQEGARGRPEGAGGGEEAPVYNVLDKAGNPTGRQVRVGKNGGMFDLSGQPTTIDEKAGEHLQPLRSGTGSDVQPAYQAPDTWEGMPDKPPPGADPTAWALALNWAQTGKTPTGLSRQTAMLAQVERLLPAAQHALGINPSTAFNQQLKIAGELAAQKYWTAGQGQRQLQYLNTTASHLNLFRQYAEALQNGETQRANSLLQRFALETGDPSITNYNAAKVLMADEVVRLLTQTGGSRGDRDDAQKLAESNFSPEQLAGLADTLQNFVRGRFEAMQTSFVHIPGVNADDVKERTQQFGDMMTPEARELFAAPQRPIPGANSPPARPTALPQGKTQWDRDSGHWRVDGKEYDANGNPL